MRKHTYTKSYKHEFVLSKMLNVYHFFCTRFLKRKRYDKFYGLCLIFQTSHIRSSEKFLSFYKEMMDARRFPFYIILSDYVWSILFYQNKDHKVRQIRFHVCIKMHRCKRRVCKRKTLFGQPNTIELFEIWSSRQFVTRTAHPPFLGKSEFRKFSLRFDNRRHKSVDPLFRLR